MNKLKILICLTMFTCIFSSCSFNKKTAKNSIEYYQYKMEELTKLRKSNTYLSYQGKAEKIKSNIKKYYEEYSNLIVKVQNDIADESTFNQYVEVLGKEEVEYLKGIDVNKIFINLNIPDINESEILSKGKDLLSILNSINDITSYLKDFEIYMNNLSSLKYASSLLSIHNDLEYTSKTYLERLNKVEVALDEVSNDYHKIFKELLLGSYKDKVVEYFSLSDKQVDSLINSSIYDDEVMKLMAKETEYVNLYDSNGLEKEETKLYLDLVNVRKEIASLLGYSNYLDYAYKELYDRDYSYLDANQLLNNIRSNKELKKLYIDEFPYLGSLTKVGEYEILNALNYASQITPKAKIVLKDMDTYGRFSFEKRNDKFTNSYMTNITNDSSQNFILLNASGTINDYASAFHEFGHYLEAEINYGKGYSGNNLDLAEINSQGLEYLSMNYYNSFLNKQDSKALISNQIRSALWTIYSACAVTEFENFVYTTNDLTISSMQTKFNEVVNSFTYPEHFGTNNGNYIYYEIPHLYLAGGYYISYLTSIIPSLELWADTNFESAKEKYNLILESGSSKPFKETLNDAELISPFKEEAILLITRKLKSI